MVTPTFMLCVSYGEVVYGCAAFRLLPTLHKHALSRGLMPAQKLSQCIFHGLQIVGSTEDCCYCRGGFSRIFHVPLLL